MYLTFSKVIFKKKNIPKSVNNSQILTQSLDFSVKCAYSFKS